MNCERIQELILTDYADGRLSGSLKSQFDSHLVGCAHCREFAQVVKEKILQPFTRAERLSPSEAVWNKIKSEITAEESETVNPFLRFVGSFQILRQPALAFSVILLMVTIVGLMVNRSPDQTKISASTTVPVTMAKIEPDNSATEVDSEDYLAYMVDEFVGNYTPNNDGYGTAIEEYFL
ncbi:MAG: zf-HC2 domain-containing protein [Candidatus Omnitrophica bacterium]|nr:zf-HC2 domain-containing protein [Candidatus Omnitrophota bacterium]